MPRAGRAGLCGIDRRYSVLSWGVTVSANYYFPVSPATSGRSTAATGRMCARDLDRANASGVLDAADAEGQLGAAEYRDRTAQAETAETIADLDHLTSDLQVPSAVRDLVPGASAVPRNPLRRAGSAGRYPDHTRPRDADRDSVAATRQRSPGWSAHC